MKRLGLNRIVLINKSFQLRQITSFVALNSLIMLAFGGCLYLFLNSEVDANLYSAHVTYKNLRSMLFPIVLTLSLLNVVVSSLILAVFVLYASHKIAGPMYRFKLALDEISRRNLSATTSVRHDDQLQEVSASLKRVAETLREDCQTMKNGLAAMKPLAGGNASPELLRTLEKLQTTVDLYRI